ncbi:MAG: NosD domain-containing protein [Candidatus Aenigmatarchaeota archaeon]
MRGKFILSLIILFFVFSASMAVVCDESRRGNYGRDVWNGTKCYQCQPPNWVQVDQCQCCQDGYCFYGSNDENDPIYSNCIKGGGTPIDYKCQDYKDCRTCLDCGDFKCYGILHSCGWCKNTNTCHMGTSSGPDDGSCSKSQWTWDYSECPTSMLTTPEATLPITTSHTVPTSVGATTTTSGGTTTPSIFEISTCTEIKTSGYYKLKTHITNAEPDCIKINADNVVFDCSGGGDIKLSITGRGGGSGITILGKNNIEIKNCIISNFADGIHLEGKNNLIKDNMIISNNYGIVLTSAKYNIFPKDNIIEHNILKNCKNKAIILKNGENNKIINNKIEFSIDGICIDNGNRNIIFKNEIISTYFGIDLIGISNKIEENNILDSISEGIHIDGNNNILNKNKICKNSDNIYDIYVKDSLKATGNENTCSLTYNYNDEGLTSGCKYCCPETVEPPSEQPQTGEETSFTFTPPENQYALLLVIGSGIDPVVQIIDAQTEIEVTPTEPGILFARMVSLETLNVVGAEVRVNG